jgi:photosystem II stability/assembly factor-like uncharacterized protein
MRRLVLLAVLVAAVVVPACSPAPPDRAVPDAASDPTFLAVTNHALAPLLLGSRGGAYTSLDGGRSWSSLEPPVEPALAMTMTNNAVQMSTGFRRVAYDLELKRSLGRPAPWPDGRKVIALASDVRRRMLWALAEGDQPRLYRSANNGGDWVPVVPNGLCRRPRALAASSTEGAPRIYAACGGRGLLVSDDLGLSFQHVEGIRDAWDVATSLSDPLMVVVATPLVRVSRDGAQTWRDGLLVAERVAIDPRNPDLVFAIAPNDRLFTSKDGGHTF